MWIAISKSYWLRIYLSWCIKRNFAKVLLAIVAPMNLVLVKDQRVPML